MASKAARPASVPGRFLRSPYTFWALLALPGLITVYRYWRGTTFYGEVLHASGELATQLLIATLAVTPLSRTFPRAGWTRWLRTRRRHIGVAAFGYSLLHAAVYVRRQDLAAIVEDAAAVAMWTGWLALLIMLALAVTSTDTAVRLLKHRWKWLHRAVYAAAALTFAHWILSAFDPFRGWVHLGVLVVLEAWRLWAARRARREAPARS